MNVADINIEQIVAKVLQRLRATDIPKTSVKKAACSNEVTIDSKLVTLTTIEGLSAQTARIVLPRDAVVTPSVKDLLRERNIEVVRDQGKSDASGRKRLVTVCGSGDRSSRLGECLQNNVEEVQGITSSVDAATAVDSLARAMDYADNLGLLLTSSPALAHCLANRTRKIRAILATQCDRLAADVAAVGANVLIVDSSAYDEKQVIALVQEFAYCGGGPCPSELRSLLN